MNVFGMPLRCSLSTLPARSTGSALTLVMAIDSGVVGWTVDVDLAGQRARAAHHAGIDHRRAQVAARVEEVAAVAGVALRPSAFSNTESFWHQKKRPGRSALFSPQPTYTRAEPPAGTTA